LASLKQPYIDDLGWLNEVCPVAYQFKNCEIGHNVNPPSTMRYHEWNQL
jgi:hypothetical protein